MDAWIPLFQSLVWPVTVGLVIVLFRVPLRRLLDAVRDRVEGGADLEIAGPAGLSARLGSLARVEPGGATKPEVASSSERAWTAERTRLRTLSRDVFLAHATAPSTVPGQKAEIFTFLVGHRRSRHGYPEDLSDVVRAEFFLGKGWGDRVFAVHRHDGERVGIRTHAYGPVLCICRVHFDDGHTAVLSRYLDLELLTDGSSTRNVARNS